VRLSIIIPTLNEAANVSRVVRHAWALNPHELIISDGGSQDGTIELAHNHDCKVIQSTPGRAIQQNMGANLASGDVLLFLHADCWPSPDCSKQISTALSNSHILAGAFHQRIAAEGSFFRLLEFGNDTRVRWFGRAYGDQGIFLRRELFHRLGGFPNVQLLEDVLLMDRIRRHTHPVLLPGPIHVSARRWQRHGIIRQTLRNWCLLSAHSVGVSPNYLAQFYQQHDQS